MCSVVLSRERRSTKKKTSDDGSIIRSEERSNRLGFSDKFENNANGRILIQKSNLAYKMNVQAHPQAELNPDVRQKTTALLGMFKGTYDVGTDNKTDRTGYSNPLNSSQKTKIAEGVTAIRQTDLGGLTSRTVQQTDDGATFVTKDRLRGIYKMTANQAKAADETGKNGVDSKTTVEAGLLGIKAFKREVVIPYEGDMKSTKTKLFGVTVSKQTVALSDEERSTRDAQVGASKPKDVLPERNESNRFVGALKDAASFVSNNRVQTAATVLSGVAAATVPGALSVANAALQIVKTTHSYQSQRQINGSDSVSTAPVSNVSIGNKGQDSSRSILSNLSSDSTKDKSSSQTELKQNGPQTVSMKEYFADTLAELKERFQGANRGSETTDSGRKQGGERLEPVTENKLQERTRSGVLSRQ
jgi:hypothetical protein